MTYAEALSNLLSLQRFGIQPGLERIHALLDCLDHPERTFPIVQVGGTNGKGSVAVMAAAILQAAGLRVGLYTSPHLCSFRERIRVNARPISQAAVAREVQSLLPALEEIRPTFFEAGTALALAHFAESEVEVAVLEVGMGGRWDATTVGSPLVSVLTRIDYDHQAYLGWSLGEIAGEKAAIIRSGRAVAAAQAGDVTEILAAQAQSAGVPLIMEGRDLSVVVTENDLAGQWLTLSGHNWTLTDVFLPLLGCFQPENALLAVAAVKAFPTPGAGARPAGLPISDTAIRRGLYQVRWPGRFQLVGRNPWVILDGAHNPAGAQALAASLKHYFDGAPLTLILGISSDKDKAGILKCLAPLAHRLILTAATNPRATPPQELLTLLPPMEGRVEPAGSVADALALALLDRATPIICVAGSLFLVADVLTQAAGGGDIPCEIERGHDSVESLFP
jgi:dihydrofolate synthase/folylpolyglutamate synthase